jgi:hypothetical protein
MITLRQHVQNPCRDIVEGRLIIPTVRTVPCGTDTDFVEMSLEETHRSETCATVETVEAAKRYLARSIAEGRTTVAPAQDWTYTQITRLRRGTPDRPVKSDVDGVPKRLVNLLGDFLKVQEAPFGIDDFKNWLERSGIILRRVSVKVYLSRFCGAGRLMQVVRGVGGRLAQYQRKMPEASRGLISAPEETDTTRQSAIRREVASTPARTNLRGTDLRSVNSRDSETEVQHGAANGRETQTQTRRSMPREENRTQGRLQKQDCYHTHNGPSAQNHRRSVPIPSPGI